MQLKAMIIKKRLQETQILRPTVLAPWTRQLEMMVAMMAPTNKISPAIKMPDAIVCRS